MTINDETRDQIARRVEAYAQVEGLSTFGAIQAAVRFGAEWQASRKVEAAPSDTDKESSLTEKASRHNLRDDTFMSILERLGEADGRDGPRHHLGNRAEAAGDLYEAAREHFSQLVQVEFTVEEWGTAVAIERSRHPEGYTAEHDRTHGLKHLANQAIDYARRGRTVEASALVLALFDAAQPVQVEVTDDMREKALADWAGKNLDEFVPEPIAGGMRYSFNSGWHALTSALDGGESNG